MACNKHPTRTMIFHILYTVERSVENDFPSKNGCLKTVPTKQFEKTYCPTPLGYSFLDLNINGKHTGTACDFQARCPVKCSTPWFGVGGYTHLHNQKLKAMRKSNWKIIFFKFDSEKTSKKSLTPNLRSKKTPNKNH